MTTNRINPLLRHVRDLKASAQAQEASDQELVERFAALRDETAFAALLRRHGPMVLGLCRRVLRQEQDAEDAFQATFLVLAKKAHALRSRESVGNWLYGVARRTALKVRTASARRRAREAVAPARAADEPLAGMTVLEAQAVVDQELAGLPEKFRAPLVLCCLEGLARDEAARQLGWPVNLVKSRLEQARERLRGRLARRGVTLPAGLLAVGLLGTAQAAVPPALVGATARAAALLAAGAAASPTVSAHVVTLAEGVARAMLWTKGKVALAAALVLAVVGLGVAGVVLPGRAKDGADNPTRAEAADPKQPDKPADALQPVSLQLWGQAQGVFTARLVKVVQGGTALSDPPVYSHKLTFQVEKVLRGSMKKGDEIVGAHSARQKAQPTFPEGKDCLVTVSFVRDQWRVHSVREAAAEDVAQAALACQVPLGWSIEGGKLLSPWAGLGKKAWPAEARGKGPLVCAETGRPALLAGAGVELTVEPVPPKVKNQYGNPDGDGEYTVTVKNTTDKPLTVPALLSDSKDLLWQESFIIRCQDKVYAVPGARGMAKPAQPAVLKPGESVSTVVNVLALQGPEWPKGGYRIEFQFCLGDKSVTRSFYYLSKHHDPLREKAAGGKE